MRDYVVHYEVALGPNQTAEGKARHYHGAKRVPVPQVLRIISMTGETGYYLIHFGDDGSELTDTLHDSIEQAMGQAKWEFGIEDKEWRSMLPASK